MRSVRLGIDFLQILRPPDHAPLLGGDVTHTQRAGLTDRTSPGTIMLALVVLRTATPDNNAPLAHSSWSAHGRGKRHTGEHGFRGLPAHGSLGDGEPRRTAKGPVGGKWRRVVVDYLRSTCASGKLPCERMDLLQFGVYRGASMRAMGLELNHSGTLIRRFWGFDSFEGLPSEDATVGTDVREWARGAFSAAAALGDYSFSSVQSKLLRYIDDPRVTFVRGFYNESLTTGLSRHVRPVLYADIDCDLYVSARDALQWMLGNGLVVSGTVVGYDDGSQEMLRGRGERTRRWLPSSGSCCSR